MGERCGSLFPQLQSVWQSPNLDYPCTTQRLGPLSTISSPMKPATDMVSPKGTLPGSVYPELPLPKVGQLNEPHGWFYCLPHYRQAFVPSVNSVLREKFSIASYDNYKEVMTPKAPSGCPQKRFLVFDQSGDHTTLIFSSGIGTHVQCFTSRSPKPTGACNLNKEDIKSKENYDGHLQPNSNDEFDKNNATDLQSEMQEDTEELNALLYSDGDSDYTEDDEVTSTGHSPSTMTSHDKEGHFDRNAEEVASCDGSNKKRKLFDSGDIPSLLDTASSVKPLRGLEYEDDAESRCAGDMNPAPVQLGFESSNKKMRKDKIRETVNILQNIIPGGKGKDAIVILDEAIQYLRYLKLKAKALGLGGP